MNDSILFNQSKSKFNGRFVQVEYYTLYDHGPLACTNNFLIRDRLRIKKSFRLKYKSYQIFYYKQWLK